MAYIIYRLKFPDGKYYIGYSKFTFTEKMEWYRKQSRKWHKNRAVFEAIKEYGFDNVEKTQLDSADTIDGISKLEAKYIEEYDCILPNGYNLKPGGIGGFMSHTEETRRKISEANKGRIYTPLTPEQRERMVSKLKARYKDKEFLAKMQERNRQKSQAYWNEYKQEYKELMSVLIGIIRYRQDLQLKEKIKKPIKVYYQRKGRTVKTYEFFNEDTNKTFIGTTRQFIVFDDRMIKPYICKLAGGFSNVLFGWRFVKYHGSVIQPARKIHQPNVIETKRFGELRCEYNVNDRIEKNCRVRKYRDKLIKRRLKNKINW